MVQEDLFKKIIAHAKNTVLFSRPVKFMTDLAQFMIMVRMALNLKTISRDTGGNAMVRLNENIVGIDAAIFMHPRTWEASGHVAAFNDPLIDNKDSKKRYRADELIEEYLGKN